MLVVAEELARVVTGTTKDNHTHNHAIRVTYQSVGSEVGEKLVRLYLAGPAARREHHDAHLSHLPHAHRLYLFIPHYTFLYHVVFGIYE